MALIISGPGVGLPTPQNLYPSELLNAPYDLPTNYVMLAPGDTLPIPATGTNGWMGDPGPYGVIQYLDPVSATWRMWSSARIPPLNMVGDGFTRRFANLTGCPVAGVIAGAGTGFAQSTATITSNVGGSTWMAIVGGSLSVSSVTQAGRNYTMAPMVFIPVPPSPGVQATAVATITGGSVTAVSLTNVGAGYISPPTAILLPNPLDPNIGSIGQASVSLVLNAATATGITAALCTNNGAPLAVLTGLTLTAAGGGGSGATITPVIMQTVASAVATAGGGGWGNTTTPPAIGTAGGGTTAVSVIGNPIVELTQYIPRQAQISATSSAAGAISAPVIVDGGLFVGPATPVITPGGTLPTTLASITLTMGSAPTTAFLQPL